MTSSVPCSPSGWRWLPWRRWSRPWPNWLTHLAWSLWQWEWSGTDITSSSTRCRPSWDWLSSLSAGSVEVWVVGVDRMAIGLSIENQTRIAGGCLSMKMSFQCMDYHDENGKMIFIYWNGPSKHDLTSIARNIVGITYTRRCKNLCVYLSYNVDGLMQGRRNSIANELELHPYCTKPLMSTPHKISEIES